MKLISENVYLYGRGKISNVFTKHLHEFVAQMCDFIQLSVTQNL